MMGGDLPWEIREGDALEELRKMPDASVNCCVTSPPYWGLRDYGVTAQMGLEATPEEYVARLGTVFRELRRVLADDGVLWLNLGDCYATGGGRVGEHPGGGRAGTTLERGGQSGGLKPKDLAGIPWRVAFALQADGWWLRSDVIWSKPNPMPESITDRPTKSHEYVFLLTKSAKYYWDSASIAEPAAFAGAVVNGLGSKEGLDPVKQRTCPRGTRVVKDTRNVRSVWTIAAQRCPEAHFATFPEEIAKRCLLSGCPRGGTVIDPFTGVGTMGFVAITHGRRFIGIELNPEYCRIAHRRVSRAREQMPLFASQEEQI